MIGLTKRDSILSTSGISGDLTELASQNEMLRILECPICKEVPFPPVFMCLKGHTLCKHCKPKLEQCPYCEEDFSEFARNFVVEEIILKSYHSCRYKEDGCEVVERGDLIESHVEYCKYRPGRCPYYSFNDCYELVKMSKVKNHILAKHQGKLQQTQYFMRDYFVPEECKAGCRKHGSTVLEYDDKGFIVNMVCKDLIFFWVILLIGTEEEATNYEGKIDLDFAKGVKITLTFPINSISDRTLRSFCEETETFKPFYRHEDLKLFGIADKNMSQIHTTYSVSRRTD